MGRPQWETIVAAAPRKKMVSFDTVIPGPFAVNQYKNIQLYAAAGKILKVIAMRIYAESPVGSTVGQHFGFLSYANPTIDIMTAVLPFSASLTFTNSGWTGAAGAEFYPSGNDSQLMALQSIVFDSATPLLIGYQNKTDVVRNTDVSVRVYCIEEMLS